MQTLKIISKGNYNIIQLNRGVANPINQQMIDELRQLLKDSATDDSIQGLILTGAAPFFTGGVDLLEVYHYDSDATKHFWGCFLKLAAEMTAFPKAIVTAITGHSPAGGCIWACCSDYRVMSEGDKFKIGLNEIAVGIAPRESILDLYAFWIGKRRAYQFLLEGTMLSGSEALEYGLIDELVPMEDVLSRAEKKMHQYLKLPPQAFQQTKAALKGGLATSMMANFEDDLDRLHTQLFSEESRTIMGQVVAYLSSKKGK
jgi:enoyl-CoA hydratase/carnithine racemase